MANFKVQEFLNSLSAETQEKVKACKTTEELQAIVEAENIDLTAFTDNEDKELSLEDLEGVEGGKGLIAGTLAAALAAITFASCGSEDILPKAAPANVAQAAQSVTTVADSDSTVSVAEAVQAATEDTQTEENAEEADTDSETENTEKKASKKKKKSKKADTAAETVQTQPAQQTQPIIIVQAAQPAQTVQAAQPAQQAQQTQPAAQQTQTTQQTQQAQTQKKQAPAQTVIPQTYAPVYVQGDMYAGQFSESRVGIGYMEITNIGNNKYAVHISWDCNSHELNTWDIVGEFDGRAAMNYTGCIKNNHKFSESGTETITTEYSNGTGSFKFEDERVLVWTDNMGDILPGTTFYNINKMPAKVTAEDAAKTKAAQTGTAGSKYYENEGKNVTEFEYVEDEFTTGNFYDVNGSKATLTISKSTVIPGTYDCRVTVPVSLGEYNTYGFNCRFQEEGPLLVYDTGALSRQVYDNDGSEVENVIVNSDHFGHIRKSGGIFEWFDNDGSYYQFVLN